LVPLASLPATFGSLDSAREIVVYCKGGVRSLRAASQLRAAGFRKVSNLTGGILGWSKDVDPRVPSY
jgi:adenylyltransferase/sulfurtransferase